MAFAPGSFTKNFGWDTDPPGLRKLHRAIRAGFNGRAQPVTRDEFRRNVRSVSDTNRQLIALNFFLHNSVIGRENILTVDELVRLAIETPHSRHFDHVAIFAPHLSELGTRRGTAGHRDEAAFLNEYVREHLWSNGGWRRSALREDEIESAFVDTMAVEGSDTAHKCMTNYRFILSLAGYLTGSAPIVNSHADDWANSAFRVAFDRWTADAGDALAADALRSRSLDAHLYRLMGLPQAGFDAAIEAAIADYLRAGSRRPGRRASARTPEATNAETPAPEWRDDTSEPATEVARRLQQLQLQVRNPGLGRELRAHYGNECCFCGKALIVGVEPDQFYSEAAHVRALGRPHNGPDRRDNMLVLCPEHHIQFDAGILTIVERRSRLEIFSRIQGDPLHGREVRLRPPHSIDPAHAKYHADFWLDR
ncbi:MAG: HNH endonuclease [Caulobacterales bacterium]